MNSSSSVLLSIIIILFLIMTICCLAKNDVIFDCVPGERESLLKLKASFSDDPTNMLASWKNNTDCCSWAGVECDIATGHVAGLHLSNREMRYGQPSPDTKLRSDTIDSSILELKYVSYLDLSGNDFQGSLIPTFLGSMKQLQYLNLSNARFSGIVPHQLGNLSSLRTLDLKGLYGHLRVDDFMWVGKLSSLEYLDLCGVKLNITKDLIKVLNMLPFLVKLRLSHRGILETFPPHTAKCVNCTLLHTHNMTRLSFLDLSTNLIHQKFDWIYDFLWDKGHLKSLNLRDNQFYGDISVAFMNLSRCWGGTLESINLNDNEFDGHLPNELGELKQLRKLHVSENMLSGPIPSSIGQLRALRVLNLMNNQMGGKIPISLGQLSYLERIFISNNSLEGTLFEAHFANLSKLEYLYVGFNYKLKFIVKDDWVPPFHQLKQLKMESVGVGSRFPQWIRTQKSLQVLDLRNCSIRGTLPAWLGSLKNLKWLYLSNNHFEGPIPELPSSLAFLDLSDNMISNHLPSNIGQMMPLLNSLDLARNLINGSIPESLCQIKDLETLDLSRNNLSGHLPNCNWGNLIVAVLSSNRLSGAIPNSLGGVNHLQWLKLDNNSLTGQIPFTLKKCTFLNVVDVGDNKLSGNLPEWIGNYLPEYLVVLRVRNNNFHGDIPSTYCQLSQLQIMDLAHNHLTGNIPHCFGNLSGMINPLRDFNAFGDSILNEVMKGVMLEYTVTTSQHLVNLDLSSNRLFGDIPLELTNLTGLNGLNLSHNHLRGTIPPRIGDLVLLESFDLSSNSLSGTIPGSLSKLTFLSFLNLSNNNLSGPIPTGSQLQTLNNHSSYDGNPGLCGAPLPKKCRIINDEIPLRSRKVENDDGGMITDKMYLYAFITSGLATGFWGYVGVLVFKRNWRLALFQGMDVLIGKMVGRY